MEMITKTFKVRKSTTLAKCHVGLFLFNGIICLKTEYQTKYDDGYHSDVYICNTGEAFWGGAKDAEERDSLMVTPIE